MRQGSFTLDNLMNYIYGEQISKIPAKLYNDDAQVKYLEFGSLYTYCCHGSKEHQIRRWLRERIAYVDSMLGYFTSQEDQVTIRMNKTGEVSFEVTPYIPLYFSVKWSNATGGTQTFKLKRGETKTFTYSSTTSTDQEVLIYHAKYIKRLDNLSNLNPSSCILSNATKLTNVEIHSSKLYNINVTNNKFLRSINLENCTALGTVTATGSSLNLSNCKYLRYCNVYNTNLTEVQLNTSGGSLTEIYYPKSIQSINLVKQRLLELIGLPYGEGGSEIPTSLYTISIQDCPSIKRLNTSKDETIASSFASMVYVNNLTIRNSLDLASLKFDGFHRLQNVTIENMYNLENVGFNNLLPVGETSTIKYIGMSNCPKLGTIELNCTSNDYEITFADDAILNFGGLFKLNSITSNCVLKGIKTIVVPINLESMFFTNEYGSGYSTIENIWVSSQCNVDTQGTTPIVTHVDSTYSGIDFLGMNLKNIDLGALVNIPKAINFKLSPTTVNPHFNLNRDGETYKYLQPVGTLDLSNYTESLAKFFDGVDLDKLEIICTNNLPQTDLSYCFYNSSFSTNDAIDKLLTKVSSITNLDYCFYKTTINSADILDEINMGASSSMNYTFAECPNIKTLNNVVIPSTVTSVEGMFNKCPLTTITNMIVNVRGSISGLFKGCNKLTTITTLRIPNVTDVSNTFDGCTSLSSLSGFELPDSCTNVSNLFNGCYMLTELGMNFGPDITAGDNWYPPNLETLNDTTISNDYVKLTNCTTLKTLNSVNISGGDLSDLFNGCTNLTNLTNCTFNATRSLARAFKGCAKITINPITTIVDTVTDISEMYSGCTGITDISGMTFGSGITNSTDCIKDVPLVYANDITIKSFIDKKPAIMFTDCSNLVSAKNVRLITSLASVTIIDMFARCTKLEDVNFVNPPKFDYCNYLFQRTSIGKNTNGVVRLYEDLGIPISSISGSSGTAMFAENPYIKEFIFPDEEFGSFYAQLLFSQCTNLKIVRNLKSNYFGTTFRFCKGANDVELINCYISTAFNSDGCAGITKLTNCTIPDNVTNMDNFFKDMAITDISGLTIGSGVTSATDWIKGSPITTANNVTIKNNVVKFTDCTNLTTCTNLDVSNISDMKEFFSICSSLTNISLYPPSNICDMTRLCYKCSSLVNIEYLGSNKMRPSILSYGFREIGSQFNYEFTSDKWDFSNCKEFMHVFYGNGLVDINMRGAKFVALSKVLQPFNNSNVDFTGSSFNFSHPVSTKVTSFFFSVINLVLDNCTISGTFNQQFKYGDDPGEIITVSMNNITLLDDLSKDWSNMFYNCIKLTSDVVIPSDVTNCTNCFKGCTKMTHIHSNWNNTYTNGITSTDCYSGCIAITHIDGENVITYEGDKGIDYVPKEWGGYGFDIDYTSIVEIVTTTENYSVGVGNFYSTTYIINDTYGSTKNAISWGDGTYYGSSDIINDSSYDSTNGGIYGSGKIPEHTYTTPGTYYIKGNFTFGGGYTKPSSLCSVVTRILNVAKKVEYSKPKNSTIAISSLKSFAYAFIGFSKCTYINTTNLVTDTCTGLDYMFGGCSSLTSLDLSSWDTSNVTDMTNTFKNCSSLTTLNLSNWNTSKVTNMASMFEGCSSLTSLDLSRFTTNKIIHMEALFSGCKNLQIITGIENWDTSNISYMATMFNGCTSLTSLDLSNFKINTVSTDKLFDSVGLSTIELNNSGITTFISMYRSMNSLKNCTSVKLSNFKFNNLRQLLYSGCPKLTSVSFINCEMSENCDINEYTFNNLPIANFDFTGTQITVDLKLNKNNAVTVDSLVNIISNLKDYSSSTAHTLTIGSTNLAKLSAAQKKVATDKNWTLA